MSNVYRNGRVHVMSAKCSTCIFRPGNLMHLEPGRVESMVEGCVRDQSIIPCHKTIHGENGRENAVCRGLFDLHRHRIPPLEIAFRVGIVEFVGLTETQRCGNAKYCRRKVRVAVGTPADQVRCWQHAGR